MNYTDRDGQAIPREEWQRLYRDPVYASVFRCAGERWQVQASWVGLAFYAEGVPQLYCVQGYREKPVVLEGPHGEEIHDWVRRQVAITWHATEQEAVAESQRLAGRLCEWEEAIRRKAG